MRIDNAHITHPYPIIDIIAKGRLKEALSKLKTEANTLEHRNDAIALLGQLESLYSKKNAVSNTEFTIELNKIRNATIKLATDE